jgi:cell division protein FtsW (lipid II flippase)
MLDFPGIHTNYIFSSIIYVFGWLAGIFIIILSITFFIRLIKTAKEVKDDYGKLLVATFSSLFIVQFIYNILMIFGLAPLTDISMPFISYGTTLNMVNMIMIGIISSVYRRKEVVKVGNI